MAMPAPVAARMPATYGLYKAARGAAEVTDWIEFKIRSAVFSLAISCMGKDGCANLAALKAFWWDT